MGHAMGASSAIEAILAMEGMKKRCFADDQLSS
jgi:3-oxoacyl-(acyl-carrier-protein) synthase